jgi:hypothetical protein
MSKKATECVKVMVRTRPMNGREKDKGIYIIFNLNCINSLLKDSNNRLKVVIGNVA